LNLLEDESGRDQAKLTNGCEPEVKSLHLTAGGILPSDVSKYAVERARYMGKIERIDEQTGVAKLPAVGAAHEASQLPLDALSSPRGLLLEGAERTEVALRVEDGLDGGMTKSADQFVLQVCNADVKTQLFHVEAREVGAEAGPLETSPEHLLLARVAKAGELRI
jgi:hypothetical protein